MRLSTRVRYGLWMMLEMARHRPGEATALSDVSKKTNISRRYLEHLATSLKNARLLLGQSGRKGGYRLTKPAGQVTIHEIVEAVAGPVNVVPCINVPEICAKSDSCECRWLYATINERITRVLDEVTLADLTDESEPSTSRVAGPKDLTACPLHPTESHQPLRKGSHV